MVNSSTLANPAKITMGFGLGQYDEPTVNGYVALDIETPGLSYGVYYHASGEFLQLSKSPSESSHWYLFSIDKSWKKWEFYQLQSGFSSHFYLGVSQVTRRTDYRETVSGLWNVSYYESEVKIAPSTGVDLRYQLSLVGSRWGSEYRLGYLWQPYGSEGFIGLSLYYYFH